MSAKNDAVLMLAGRIGETCAEALIEWGAAVNEAEALPAGALKDVATTKARLLGTEAMRLGMGIAAKLRPRRTP